ncbi:MAG: hypothetical protein ACAH83_16270 [Alphaproteobacteria bacterium]
MALEQDFNPAAATDAFYLLRDKTLPETAEWLSRLERQSPEMLAGVEASLLQSLTFEKMYTRLYDAIITSVESGRDKPDFARKILNDCFGGIDRDGIDGMLRKRALICKGLAQTRGAQTHPAIRFYADEASRLTDEDYKGLVKPLRLLNEAIVKASAVVSAARRFIKPAI